jgi:hypothetical protein
MAPDNRSASVSARRDRCRGGGRIPPVWPACPVPSCGDNQRGGLSSSVTRHAASVPTSAPCRLRCSESVCDIPSATSSPRPRELRCCIDHMNPQSLAAALPRCEMMSVVGRKQTWRGLQARRPSRRQLPARSGPSPFDSMVAHRSTCPCGAGQSDQDGVAKPGVRVAQVGSPSGRV